MPAHVVAVARSAQQGLPKSTCDEIRLVAGRGVEGDAHFGVRVRHRSRRRRDPTLPNLRQVHLLPAELLDELEAGGFAVGPGLLGENVTTRGVDLLALPRGTRLLLGADAVVELTGLRNPCRQLDALRPGLMAALAPRDAFGEVRRRAGVMGIVSASGRVGPGDGVVVTPPAANGEPLRPV